MSKVGGAFLLASLLVSQVSLAEVRPITVRGGGPQFELGRGVNSATSEQMSRCIASADGKPSLGQFRQDIKVEFITSSRSVVEMLDVGSYAAYFGGFSDITSRIRFGDQDSSTKQRASFYMKVVVTGVSQTLQNEAPSAAAITAIENGIDEFSKACGDSFIYQVESGAEFLAVISYNKDDEEKIKTLQSQLQLHLGTLATDASARNEVKKIAQDLDVKITLTQTGLGGQSPPSLVDIDQLLDYGRQFGQRVNKEIASRGEVTAPYRVHLQRYDSSLEFRNAMNAAKRTELLNFDPTIRILDHLVEEYDTQSARLHLVRQALTNPAAFERFDRPTVLGLQPLLVNAVNSLAELAANCAQSTKSGKQCSEAAYQYREIDPDKLPKLLRSCQITEAAKTAGCTAVESVDGTCRCSACDFVFDKHEAALKSPIGGICRNMPPGRTAIVSVNSSIGHLGDYRSNWFIVRLNQEKEFQLANQYGSADYATQAELNVPDSGDVPAQLVVTFCQADTRPELSQKCTIEPRESKDPMITVRVKE